MCCISGPPRKSWAVGKQLRSSRTGSYSKAKHKPVRRLTEVRLVSGDVKEQK